MTSGRTRWSGGGARSVDRVAFRTNVGRCRTADRTTGSAAVVGLGPSIDARAVRSSEVPRGTSIRTQPQFEGSRKDGPETPSPLQQDAAAFGAVSEQHDRSFGSFALQHAAGVAAQPHHVHPRPEGTATTKASKSRIQGRGIGAPDYTTAFAVG